MVTRKHTRGQMIVGAVVLMVVLMLAMPALLRLFRTETLQTETDVNVKLARRLADVGLEKGYFKISESSQVYTAALAGTIPSGYAGDAVFSDQGGEYKIQISSGPQAEQLTILSKARAGGTIHAVRAVYERPTLRSAFAASASNGANFASINSQVHWGFITGQGIGISAGATAPLMHYPRLKSQGPFYGSTWDNNPAPPNSNDVNWWAYSSTDTPPTPLLDYDYYRERARASVVPTTLGNGRIYQGTVGTTLAVASPAGSGLFPMQVNNAIRITQTAYPGYRLIDPTAVIFFDVYTGWYTSLDPVSVSSGTFLDVEAVISMRHKIVFSGTGSGVYGATIPVTAPLEYASAIGAAAWSAGVPSMATVYASANRCCYPLNNVFIKGMVNAYLQGPFLKFHGTVISETGDLANIFPSHYTLIYYDDTVAKKVRLINPPQRLSWDRVKVAW